MINQNCAHKILTSWEMSKLYTLSTIPFPCSCVNLGCISTLWEASKVEAVRRSASSVASISELFGLFLPFFTPVRFALFSSCLAELGRQLLSPYCLFVRSIEITGETVVLPASDARSNGRKCFSSTYSPKWSIHYLFCACALHTDVVRVRGKIWTLSSMGLRWLFGLLDFRRIPECVSVWKLYFCVTIL